MPAGARRAMRAELRDMLVAYLGPWLEPSASGVELAP